jgi:hypothetical protein
MLMFEPAMAQTVTYCDAYAGPLNQFMLNVDGFELSAYALAGADVELNVSYSGQLSGQNTSTTTPCWWSFGMNLGVASQTFDLDPYTFLTAIAAEGEIPVAGGVEPNIVTVPLSGTIVAGYSIPWSELTAFYNDRTLTFTTPSLGGVSQMGGAGVFSFSCVISAEVCVTYTYDNAVGQETASFGTLKAIYR